jgi:hypothetical protein
MVKVFFLCVLYRTKELGYLTTDQPEADQPQVSKLRREYTEKIGKLTDTRHLPLDPRHSLCELCVSVVNAKK